MTAPPTREALWERIRVAGLVDGSLPALAESAPWYVRAMLVAAGWLAAAFLVGFTWMVLDDVLRNPRRGAPIGLIACAAGAALLRRSRASLLVGQVGLAIAIAGQALLLLAYAQWFSEERAMLALSIQQALLLVLVPHFLHRAWAAWTSAIALAWAGSTAGIGGLAHAAVMAACLAAWHGELAWPRHGALLRAAGVGLALAVAQLAVWPLTSQMTWAGTRHPYSDVGEHILEGRIAMIAVLLGGAVVLLWREAVRLTGLHGRAALAGAAVLGAIAWYAPGVATATALLVVGHAAGSRTLAGLGILAMLGALGQYYYALEATLLEKAGHMVVCGVVLLAARIGLEHLWSPGAGDRA